MANHFKVARELSFGDEAAIKLPEAMYETGVFLDGNNVSYRLPSEITTVGLQEAGGVIGRAGVAGAFPWATARERVKEYFESRVVPGEVEVIGLTKKKFNRGRGGSRGGSGVFLCAELNYQDHLVERTTVTDIYNELAGQKLEWKGCDEPILRLWEIGRRKILADEEMVRIHKFVPVVIVGSLSSPFGVPGLPPKNDSLAA
jgi:hypothetical protein